MASTSGKYLYNVARPMPACSAIVDMVTEASPLARTTAAVVSRIASSTARRCALIVSFHNFGTVSVYVSSAVWQDDLSSDVMYRKAAQLARLGRDTLRHSRNGVV